jgi:outer membrane immunogenic protein
MKNLLWGSVTLIALLATPAVAADMAVRATPPVPVPPPVFSWTGCYLGGHAGGGWISKQFNGPFKATELAPLAVTTTGLVVVPLSDTSVDDNGSGGFLGGVQVGCNYQYASNWVVGIDGDASWGGLTASTNQNEFTNVPAFSPPPTESQH